MSRNIIRIGAGVVFVFMIIACPQAGPCATKEPSKHSGVFMWSVSGPKASAHILGTLHALSRDSSPPDPRIEKAYQTCSRVMFEADPGAASEEEVRGTMLRLGVYPEGTVLKDEISPKTYAALKKRVEGNGIDMAKFDRFRPWFAALSVATVEFKRLGFKPGKGLDAHFYQKAATDRKEMLFLETPRQQLEILSNASPNHEDDILRQALDELGVVEKSSEDMVKAWKKGDAPAMEAFTRKSLKAYPDIERRLFADRNRAWAERIVRELSREGDVFVVVGAAHLVGKDGVLEMLRKAGYTPRQE